MDLGLEGRTAVVTGASRGIGLAIVRALAAAGARVIAGARGSSGELDELVRTLWLGKGGVAATVGAATGARPEDVESQAAHQMVTGRFTRPADVADLVLFPASDRTTNVTGADFTIATVA